MTPTEPVTFEGFDKDLEISRIEIADENVRKTEVKVDLEGLKQSIKERGLVQPVVVIKKAGEYELLVGQRRLIAYQELGHRTIPALIIHDVDPDDRRFISFAENSFRRELPYDDTVELCARLFDKLGGDKVSKVARIAQQLNVHPNTVLRYLSYQLIPKTVRDMVEGEKLTRGEAYKITSAFWPNESKMVEMAKQTLSLTKAERDQALKLGLKDPGRPLAEIIEEAKKSSVFVRVPILIDRDTYATLRQRARHRGSDMQGLLSQIIEDWIRRDVR